VICGWHNLCSLSYGFLPLCCTFRLCEISAQSRCLLQALPMQVPFHSYEDEVYALVEPRMPPLNPLHVEVDLSRSTDSMPNLGASLSLSPMKR
jgi:hypothetical protein